MFSVQRTPIKANVATLKVFIAYKTEQWGFAAWLADQLRIVGFPVLIAPPSGPQDLIKPRSAIEAMLRNFAEEADRFCLIASPRSVDSEWVQFEYKSAVESIGRLTFVCEDALFPAGEQMAAKNPGRLSERIYIRSNTVLVSSKEDKTTGRVARLRFLRDNAPVAGEIPSDLAMSTPPERIFMRTDRLPVTGEIVGLAHELINDPEEGGWPELSKTKRSHPTRDLKVDSLMRKYARSQAMKDTRFLQRFIFDVLPYLRQEVSSIRRCVDMMLQIIPNGLGFTRAKSFTGFDCALKDILEKFGLFKAKERLADGIVEPMHSSYLVPCNHPLHDHGIRCVEAFVLLAKPGWQDILAKKAQDHRDGHEKALEAIRRQMNSA